MNGRKKMLWIATDLHHDCLRCAMPAGACKMCCDAIAKELGVFSVYAVTLKEPEKEYQGM